MITFCVPGQPQGKGRARSTKSGRHYTPAKTVAYERLIAQCAAEAMGDWQVITGPAECHVIAVFGVPASWSKKRREAALQWVDYPTVKPDGDNIAKAVKDALNGLVWIDDSQVVDLRVKKVYGSWPRLDVTVGELT